MLFMSSSFLKKTLGCSILLKFFPILNSVSTFKWSNETGIVMALCIGLHNLANGIFLNETETMFCNQERD